MTAKLRPSKTVRKAPAEDVKAAADVSKTREQAVESRAKFVSHRNWACLWFFVICGLLYHADWWCGDQMKGRLLPLVIFLFYWETLECFVTRFAKQPTEAQKANRFPMLDYTRGYGALFINIFHWVWISDYFWIGEMHEESPYLPNIWQIQMAVFVMYVFVLVWALKHLLVNFSYRLGTYVLISTVFFCVSQWRFYNVTIGVWLMMLCIGITSAISHENGKPLSRYLKRLVFIALGAAFITYESHSTNPKHSVWFGALHMIFVNSLLHLPVVGRPRLAFCLAFLLTSCWVARAFTGWDWLMPEPEFQIVPAFSLDYQPILKNLMFVFWGIWLHSKGWHKQQHLSIVFGLVRQPRSPYGMLLTWVGNWALQIFILHQIVFYYTGWALYYHCNGVW